MDDNDSLDQALSDLIGSSTRTVADEDRVYRLVVDRARGRVVHRRLAISAVTMALVAAIVITVVATRLRHAAEVRVQGPSSVATSTTATTSPREFPQIKGMTIVSDDNGPVGYAPTARLIPSTREAFFAMNAKTLIPVTGADGTLVGYEAQSVGFIPLATAQQPDFDVEDLRADLNNGCEPQIGDPTFEQKYPRCPPPPPVASQVPVASFGANGRLCQVTRLAVRHGPSLATASGQGNVVIAFENTSSSSCTLLGYPTIRVLDSSGRQLPFKYTHAYGMFVTHALPQPVLVPPGAAAYAAFEKYRCDLGTTRHATTVQVRVPGSIQPFDLKIGEAFGYCGARDPGSRIVVTPIEPTVRLLGYGPSH